VRSKGGERPIRYQAPRRGPGAGDKRLWAAIRREGKRNSKMRLEKERSHSLTQER